jgi:hypothetical protein
MDEKPSTVAKKFQPLEYRYLTEFQSHDPEFDYLKSLEIEEKINKVHWIDHNSAAKSIRSTNHKNFNLWKVPPPPPPPPLHITFFFQRQWLGPQWVSDSSDAIIF